VSASIVTSWQARSPSHLQTGQIRVARRHPDRVRRSPRGSARRAEKEERSKEERGSERRHEGQGSMRGEDRVAAAPEGSSSSYRRDRAPSLDRALARERSARAQDRWFLRSALTLALVAAAGILSQAVLRGFTSDIARLLHRGRDHVLRGGIRSAPDRGRRRSGYRGPASVQVGRLVLAALPPASRSTPCSSRRIAS
jgi:hypothetical protein